MRDFRAAFCAALFLFSAFTLSTGHPAAAQDVTLTSRDGAVEVSGTLLGFDGEFYRVDTVYGELTLDGAGVRCAGPGCPSLSPFVAQLTFSGAQTAGEVLLPALIEAFALREGHAATRTEVAPGRVSYLLSDGDGHPVARLHIHATSADEGFADLLANEADVLMSRRPLSAEELARAREAGLGDMRAPGRSRVLALDALVPVTAPGLPLRAISLPDLAAVFAGRITNWSELGGPDAPIGLHLHDRLSGLAQAVEERLLVPAGLSLHDHVTRHRGDRALVRAVEDDPFALALASRAQLGVATPLALAGSCGFAVAPSRQNAKTEDYPLTAPVYLFTPARRLPKIGRDLLRYTRSTAAQLVIRRAGFIDQQPEELPIADQGDRFANAILRAGPEVTLDDLQRMTDTLRAYRRLTLSFRFEAGSSALDTRSRSNVRRLAAALEEGRYDGRTLLFAGFSDGAGSAEQNRRIAGERAEAVRRAVLSAAETLGPDQVRTLVDAFGEAMPMACDDSAWGARVNRRVEVWLR